MVQGARIMRIGAVLIALACVAVPVSLVVRRNRSKAVSNSRAYAYHGLDAGMPGDLELEAAPLEVAAFEPPRPTLLAQAGGPPPREQAGRTTTPGGLKLVH